MIASPTQSDRAVYRGSFYTLGEFRLRPGDDRWDRVNLAREHVICFPRRAVVIERVRGCPLVADPNVATLYNPGDEYRRRALCDEGDECEYLEFDAPAALEAMAAVDPRARERSGRVFLADHAPADARAYALQRSVYDEVVRRGLGDPLAADEAVASAVYRVLRASLAPRDADPRQRDDTRRAHAELGERAKSVLGQTFREGLALSELARRVHASPFHLCRVFLRHTGVTLTRYRDQLRLKESLGLLADTRWSLAGVALRVGYASHSHFTDAFTRGFGVPPSVYRADPRTVRVPR